jgi:hypothetical protein
MDAEVIRSIPLGMVRHNDQWAWHFKKNGVFSVPSAYKLSVKTKNEREAWLADRLGSSSNDQNSWSMLWKTKVPSKIRVFLWRLSHQSLPTGTTLYV